MPDKKTFSDWAKGVVQEAWPSDPRGQALVGMIGAGIPLGLLAPYLAGKESLEDIRRPHEIKLTIKKKKPKEAEKLAHVLSKIHGLNLEKIAKDKDDKADLFTQIAAGVLLGGGLPAGVMGWLKFKDAIAEKKRKERIKAKVRTLRQPFGLSKASEEGFADAFIEKLADDDSLSDSLESWREGLSNLWSGFSTSFKQIPTIAGTAGKALEHFGPLYGTFGIGLPAVLGYYGGHALGSHKFMPPDPEPEEEREPVISYEYVDPETGERWSPQNVKNKKRL